jgi:hypothetical protein
MKVVPNPYSTCGNFLGFFQPLLLFILSKNPKSGLFNSENDYSHGVHLSASLSFRSGPTCRQAFSTCWPCRVGWPCAASVLSRQHRSSRFRPAASLRLVVTGRYFCPGATPPRRFPLLVVAALEQSCRPL